MSKIAIITEEQADELKTKHFNGVNYNPIKDINNNWIISIIYLKQKQNDKSRLLIRDCQCD